MKIKFIALLLLTAAWTMSCKKEKTSQEQRTDIFIAGMQWDSLSGKDVSGYWKNDVFNRNALTSNYNHYANAIALSGDDVYITGFENRPTEWKCQVWKNGQHQYSLSDTYSEGRAIAVSGSDVYVGCYLYEAPSTRMAALWKNQLPPTIFDTSINSYSPAVNDLAISGADVYAGGFADNMGKIWKNGTDMGLTNTAGITIKAIAVAGTDVYATANIGTNTIRYWKNNTYTDITVTGGRQIYVSDIAVEGNDVYVSGWENTGTIGIAKYWKNGLEVSLGDGVRSSTAWGIAVKNGKVYVAGNSAAGSVSFIDYATIWENGVVKVIGARNSRATSIAVK